MILYILTGLILVYIGFSLYSRKWNNPYTLTFLFGRKGAGKTTLMAKLMLKYSKKGWSIYTDVSGIKITGVRVFNIRDLISCSPPPRSVVFLDEVGLTMDNRNYKAFAEGLRDWYALQRHYKCRVYVNSQAFDVDKKVRDRTDNFYYCTKIAGTISIARPIVLKIRPNDMTNPACDSPIATCYKWGPISGWMITWLPRYAKLFDSFDAPSRPDVSWTEIKPALDDLTKSPSRIMAEGKQSGHKGLIGYHRPHAEDNAYEKEESL